MYLLRILVSHDTNHVPHVYHFLISVPWNTPPFAYYPHLEEAVWQG